MQVCNFCHFGCCRPSRSHTPALKAWGLNLGQEVALRYRKLCPAYQVIALHVGACLEKNSFSGRDRKPAHLQLDTLPLTTGCHSPLHWVHIWYVPPLQSFGTPPGLSMPVSDPPLSKCRCDALSWQYALYGEAMGASLGLECCIYIPEAGTTNSGEHTHCWVTLAHFEFSSMILKLTISKASCQSES